MARVVSARADAAAQPGAAAAPVGFSEFSRYAATFRNRALEEAYQRHLATNDLPQQRRIWLLMTLVYFSYGFLDILTIGEPLVSVLIVRWLVVTPIALALYALSFVPRLKPFTGRMFALCVFLSAISIVWMISVLPESGAPPYIVGILIVFIFSSCNVQMPFVAASAVFTLTTIAYSFVLFGEQRFSRTDIISGHFFMISSAGVAIVTNYVQEIRLRMIWINGERRKSDARRIEQLMIEATAADSSKINFLSVLTHELRTPLHQVIGLSEVVRAQVEQRNSSDLSNMLDQVIASAQGLLKKLGQMLRYADATAGRLDFQYDFTPARELAEKLYDQFAEKAAGKVVRFEIDNVSPHDLYVDAHHTSYALANLVDNAINACERNGRVAISGSCATDGRYVLEIIDDGVGISESQRNAALGLFEQTEPANVRTREGVGLGLTLALKLLSAQNAELSLEPHPVKGTVARVTFALTPVAPESRSQAA